jgi:hypothetical protein
MHPHARRPLILALALPLLAAWATDAPAQWLPEPAAWVTGDESIAVSTGWEAVPAIGAPRIEPVRVDGRRVVNTTLGAAGGFAVGAVIGGIGVYSLLPASRSEVFPHPHPGDGYVLGSHDIAGAVVVAYGAIAGASVGAPLGAHWANGRRGSLWLGVLGSAAATTAAAWLLPLGSGGPGTMIVLPLVSVGTSATIELLTTR